MYRPRTQNWTMSVTNPFAITVAEHDTVAVMTLTGELDIGTTGEFFDRAEALVDRGYRHVVLDLSELSFCDSGGLGTIVKLRKRLGSVDGTISIAAANPMIASLLELTGLDQVIKVFPSLSEALGQAE